MQHTEKKCCKLHSTARNEWSVRFGEKLKQLHLARNKKNRLRSIIPGQSFAETDLNYKQALDEYDEARKAYDEILKKDDNERVKCIKKHSKRNGRTQ